MTRRFRAGTLAVLAGLAIAGCRRDAAEPENPAPPPAAAPAVPLVSLGDLRTAVPELSGWQRGAIDSREVTDPARAAHVAVTFVRGREQLDLEITDTAGNLKMTESLAGVAGSALDRRVANGYFRGTMLGGFPAVESWNTVEKLGEVSVLVGHRIIVHVSGTGLADAKPMRALIEGIDLKRLSEMKSPRR